MIHIFRRKERALRGKTLALDCVLQMHHDVVNRHEETRERRDYEIITNSLVVMCCLYAYATSLIAYVIPGQNSFKGGRM